ncbi:hypothetical protein G6514_001011 [Epicoccum nigrum]|nr:hypothetical protein G6514_001011 [Epicoccum nigrum]
MDHNLTYSSYYLVYPSREQVQISKGEDVLRTYAFGPEKNLHKFCSHCGSSIFFDPRMKEFGEGGGMDLLGVNVRMFHDVIIEKLDLFPVDNRDKLEEKSE